MSTNTISTLMMDQKIEARPEVIAEPVSLYRPYLMADFAACTSGRIRMICVPGTAVWIGIVVKHEKPAIQVVTIIHRMAVRGCVGLIVALQRAIVHRIKSIAECIKCRKSSFITAAFMAS
jgi:hypothetical protein